MLIRRGEGLAARLLPGGNDYMFPFVSAEVPSLLWHGLPARDPSNHGRDGRATEQPTRRWPGVRAFPVPGPFLRYIHRRSAWAVRAGRGRRYGVTSLIITGSVRQVSPMTEAGKPFLRNDPKSSQTNGLQRVPEPDREKFHRWYPSAPVGGFDGVFSRKFLAQKAAPLTCSRSPTRPGANLRRMGKECSRATASVPAIDAKNV